MYGAHQSSTIVVPWSISSSSSAVPPLPATLETLKPERMKGPGRTSGRSTSLLHRSASASDMTSLRKGSYIRPASRLPTNRTPLCLPVKVDPLLLYIFISRGIHKLDRLDIQHIIFCKPQASTFPTADDLVPVVPSQMCGGCTKAS